VTQRGQSRLYAAVLAFATTAFVALAAAVLFWERADRLDVRFVNWVHRTAPEIVVDVMQVLTYAGSAVFLGSLTIIAGLLFVRTRRSGAALFVLVAFVGSQVIDQILKAIVRRSRPELEDPFVQLTTYAFPSVHAFTATATYGALALVLASTAAERPRRVALVIGAAALILVVAASRVIVGAHFLLDVSAGIAGGVALVSALLLVMQRATRPGLRVVLFSGHEQPERTRLDP
jgi:membrane-associated phospholipid phosphatase